MEIIERYRAWLAPDEMVRLAQAVRRPLLPALRVNTLKISVKEARQRWPQWYGWQVRPVSFCPTGWQITVGGDNASRTPDYKMGFYYIQDVASMLPVEMFDFNAGARPLVLDMAASPGGKTTHLVSRLNDRGLVVANDVSAGRMAALRTNLMDWGATSTVVTSYPGERFGAWFPDSFDYVLVDAPCSGEALRTAERRKGRPVSPEERQVLHQRQVRLLTSAFQALKPGGQLVYATCSLNPLEDEAVVDALLQAFSRQATVESVEQVVGVVAPGLASDGERDFDPQVTRAVRLWPHLYDTAGFFAARIAKRAAVAVRSQPPPRRTWSQAGLRPIARQEFKTLSGELLEWGFDLRTTLQVHELSLWKREAVVFAIPDLLLSELGELPFITPGMVIGELTPDGFVPSHELVARFATQFSERRISLSDEQAQTWSMGRDLRGFEKTPFQSRTVVLMEDAQGRLLGRGKILHRRIRNLLPRRLVY